MLAFGTMTSFAFELAQALRHLAIQLFGLRAVWYYHIVFLHNSKIECDSFEMVRIYHFHKSEIHFMKQFIHNIRCIRVLIFLQPKSKKNI